MPTSSITPRARPDGGITPAPARREADAELTINADVEPDEDADGFGDETQDQCLGTAGPQNGCAAATGQRAAALQELQEEGEEEGLDEEAAEEVQEEGEAASGLAVSGLLA